MKKLPVGIQTFYRLISENCLYVDKTALIYQLVTEGSCYFLSRPRRFGKSLLVSTLESLFSGNKELFKGLAIDSLPYEWKQYPVIIISFADIESKTPEELDKNIKIYLQRIAQKHNILLDQAVSTGQMLQDLITQLSQENPVVLLIDEYDYSILRHVHNPDMANKIREVLRNFYGVIKGLDKYLKFVLLTGISQFSKTSLFSGLNNLEDISLSQEYNALLGYTRDEIIHHFAQHLISTAQKTETSVELLLDDITQWYDGYRFTRAENSLKMYNPFSVLLCLKKSEFANYWFETGTPTFLINLFKEKNYPIQDFESIEATTAELKQFEVDNINLKTLLFQTGYLTIKKYNKDSDVYTLGFPNKENTRSLVEYIFASMTEVSSTYLYNTAAALKKIFDKHLYEQLEPVLTQLYAAIPYTIHIDQERYYQTIFYTALKMIGAHIIVEQATNVGCMDAILETKDTYFIIEFKINKPAHKALEQIKKKKYYQPYEMQGKNIVLIGISFDTTQKNISGIEHEKYC